jgi:PAS domain S-box-containing protein
MAARPAASPRPPGLIAGSVSGALAAVATPLQAELMQAALLGTGTYVWEWQIDTDHLSDVELGAAMLGWEAHEIGPTQEDWNRLIHPDDLAANEEAYQRHVRGEVDTYEHSYRARARDGSWRWVIERGRIVERDAAGQPLRMVGTQTDITERRMLEAQASADAARLEKIARHAPGVLFQFEMGPDQRARFPYLSEAAHELFELDPNAAIHDSSPMFRVIEREDRRRVVESSLASARDLTEWRCEFRIRRADGSLRWIQGSSTPQRQAYGVTVWHGYLQDVTDNRELARAREAAAVAAAANRAKTEFLSRMSHELRTPLNAVLGFAQLMEIDRNEPPGDGQKRRLALIREAGEHLLQMIGDLLDLTRIETGGMALQAEPLSLRALASQSLEMVRAAAEKAQLQLLFEPGVDDPLALADRTRTRQVLLNLLSNAVKYNRPGGSVTVRVQRDAQGWPGVVVSDTGQGIAAADLPHIFEPFHRGAQARGLVDGAGIGLSVTQALVQLMGGRIEATSQVGAGSRFSLSLPPAEAPQSST